MKHAFALLLVMMLCACAMTQKIDTFSPLMNKWVGRSVDDLVVTYGAPSDGYILDSGGRVFEYFRDRMAPSYSKSEKKAVGVHYEPNGVPGSAGNLIQDDTTGLRPRTVRHKNTTCMILFTVAANNIIQSWSQEGDGCD